MKEMFESQEVKVHAVSGSQEALPLLLSKEMGLDAAVLELPDPEGFLTLQIIHSNPECSTLPTLVYLTSELTQKEEEELRRASKVCVIKELKSPERLADEAALFPAFGDRKTDGIQAPQY